MTGGANNGVSINNGVISMQHNYRAYLVANCSDQFEPSMYAQRFPLLGMRLSYSVDLSAVGCGCNAALYAVSMPGYDSNQNPAPSTGKDYYCDANDVGGTWCPEMDVQEANNMAWQTTPHTCDTPVGNYYPACDKSGCGVNTYRTSTTAYGPGAGYTINTQQPFNVSLAFQAQGGQLSSIVTTFTQGSGMVNLTHTDKACGAGYLEKMSTSLANGMVVTMSLWGDTGSTMQWLDVPPCDVNTACNTAAALAKWWGISLTQL